MTAKSELNIFCQKTKQAPPLYSSYISGGQSHAPLFIGQCQFNNKEYKTDKQFITKKEADNAVAEIVLTNLYVNDTNPIIDTKESLLLVIDLDNQNQFTNYIEQLEEMTNSFIIGYGGLNLTLPNVKGSHIKFKNTKSINRDSADIELAFLMGQMENKGELKKFKKIIIFSTDYALATVKDILIQNGYNAEFECSIVNWLK